MNHQSSFTQKGLDFQDVHPIVEPGGSRSLAPRHRGAPESQGLAILSCHRAGAGVGKGRGWRHFLENMGDFTMKNGGI